MADTTPFDTKSLDRQMIREFGMTEDQYWNKMSLCATDFVSDKEMYKLMDEYMLSGIWNTTS